MSLDVKRAFDGGRCRGRNRVDVADFVAVHDGNFGDTSGSLTLALSE